MTPGWKVVDGRTRAHLLVVHSVEDGVTWLRVACHGKMGPRVDSNSAWWNDHRDDDGRPRCKACLAAEKKAKVRP